MAGQDNLIEALVKASQAWTSLVDAQVKAFRTYKPALNRLAGAVESIHRTYGPLLEKFERYYGSLLRHEKWANLVLGCGFLPHRTLPELPDGIAAEEAEVLISDHYRANWAEIRAEIEKAVTGFDIDDEAKAAFREALDAHEAGLYRAAVRTIFPEIERVARIEWNIPVNGAPIGKLKELISSLPLSSFGPLNEGRLKIVSRFFNAIWSKADTLELLEEVKNSDLPNRHASLHGLVPYGSEKHSLNAIITAECVFGLLTVAKSAAEIDASEPD